MDFETGYGFRRDDDKGKGEFFAISCPKGLPECKEKSEAKEDRGTSRRLVHGVELLRDLVDVAVPLNHKGDTDAFLFHPVLSYPVLSYPVLSP